MSEKDLEPPKTGGPAGLVPPGGWVLAEYIRCPVCNNRPEVEIWHDVESVCPNGYKLPQADRRDAPERFAEGSNPTNFNLKEIP
jgi:hypothetical protein